MTPVVLLDMDGPLADFDGLFWGRCKDAGIEFDILRPSEQRHYYLTEHIPDREQRRWARNMVDRAGWFYDLPVVPGARDGVQALMEIAEVWVCTKPLDANPTCRDDKAAWLQEHIPELHGRMITASDKSLVCGDVILDDHLKPAWFDRSTWTPVVYPTPFNRNDHLGLPRWTWGDDPEQLVALARRNTRVAPGVSAGTLSD